jgi:hypothetical protein
MPKAAMKLLVSACFDTSLAPITCQQRGNGFKAKELSAFALRLSLAWLLLCLLNLKIALLLQ